MHRVVIGSGPDAVRAAAVRATGEGAPVLLLLAHAKPEGVDHPELPVGIARFTVGDGERPSVERVLGTLVESPDASVAVISQGHVARLPMSPLDVPRLMEGRVARAAARAWLHARGRNALAELVGGGQEERTHRDWVVRRMGGPAWQHLYRDYAARRWGLPSEELACSVAHLHHSHGPGPVDQQVVGGGYDAALAVSRACIEAGGGEIRTGVEIEGFDVDGGVVTAVRVAGESIPFEGRLWVTAPPSQVMGWLGSAAPEALIHEAKSLDVRPVLRTALAGDVDGLAWETHVLDEGAPFWRVICPYGVERTAIFHTTLSGPEDPGPTPEVVADAARALGIGSFDPGRARVERLAHWQPVWRPTSQARVRRLLLEFESFGLIALGRAGAFAPIDPVEEVRLARAHLAEAEPREVHRTLVEPPVRVDDLDARITRFVVR